MTHAPRRSSFSVLFACRDNSGLSLLAEAIANGRVPDLRAFSAGVTASGTVDLTAVECLHAARVPADGLSSKPMELFAFSGAPRIDIVVSLVEGVEREAQRFADRIRCAAHHRWRLEDVAGIVDIHARRLAYRRLLPELSTAIGALGRQPAFAA